jgi:hypothetical protein
VTAGIYVVLTGTWWGRPMHVFRVGLSVSGGRFSISVWVLSVVDAR